jgi:SAM-dependent methyltransferase
MPECPSFPFERWFDARFAEVVAQFDGKVFSMDAAAGTPPHNEAASLRKSRWRYRDSLRMIAPELGDPGDRRFLDVGGGHLAWFAAARFPGRTFAADLGATFVAEAHALGVETCRWDLTADATPFPDGSFDIVAFTEVLEHLPPPPFPYVRRVAATLKPGGLLLFSVPNMVALLKRVKFLFGRSPLKLGQVARQQDGNPEHLREYSVPEVKQIMLVCGLRIERWRTGDYGRGVWHRAATAVDRLAPHLGRTIIVRARKL